VKKLLILLLLSASVALALPGCARDTGDAGVKPIGVGYDPGDLFPGPEERGGVIDLVLVETRGTNLDFGVTGFFGSSGAFEPGDPMSAILGWGWFFSPALLAADEYSGLSPKGPDLLDECFVQQDTNGPLGSFDTVDVGDELVFTNAHEDPAERTSFSMPRNPQDYPLNTSSVFIYYVGTQPHRIDDPLLPDNWAFGQDVQMQFTGALPPEGAPVPSIPLPSDAADERVGKESGNPSVFTPEELLGLATSNRLDEAGQVDVRFAPLSPGQPNPLANDGVLHVTWDAPVEESDSFVTIGILLLGEAEGEQISDAFGNPDFCIGAEALPVEGERDEAWFVDYFTRKEQWCDAGYEPDLELGNDEFGLDIEGEDTCHDELDNDDSGTCDEGGCFAADGVTWLPPDGDCARHGYQTSTCGTDGLCRPVGGDRGFEGHMAELLCTADDDGDFVVPADQITALMGAVDPSAVAGAVLKVARISETLIDVPMVRDPIGNENDINPVRLRASQVVHGRFDWGE